MSQTVMVSRNRVPFGQPFCLFLILSISGMFLLYRDALWGHRLLAPLDVAPNLFAKYKWMDPKAKGIPRNHYIVDMFDFELPRQFAFYQGIQSGEFPWWEPYSDGGHPLAAEAHNNLTDPFRLLLYRLLPFELAYNWIRPIHSFLLGLSMFALLSHLRFSAFAALFGALSFQFASNHPLFVFPPCVAGTFLYFPFIWTVWSSFLESPRLYKIALGALLCGAVICSGNQQTHAYLPLFAGCFCLGYGWTSGALLKRTLYVTSASGLSGALLALPVLIPQIEIFLQSKRDLIVNYHPAGLISGVLSLSGVFPWILGTFRTLDLSKLANESALGFSIYIGTAGILLALLGMSWRFRSEWRNQPELRTSICLVFCYLGLICSTPLLRLLYLRSADLAVMGLIVCAARGIDALTNFPGDGRLWKFLIWSNVALAVVVVALNLLSFVVYPRLLPRIKAYVLSNQAVKSGVPASPGFRIFQVENWAREVTLRNPETALALMSGFMLLPLFKFRSRTCFQAAALILNLCPLLIFADRFLPSVPISDWQLLLQGGPEQKRLRQLVSPEFKRLEEQAPTMFDCVFPGATALYYHVHTFNNYSAFFLKSSSELRNLPPSNVRYTSDKAGGEQGLLDQSLLHNDLRFTWEDQNPRRILIAKETLNSITLKIEPGPVGRLVRTDSYYPGWKVMTSQVKTVPGKAQDFEVPSDVSQIRFQYEPSYLTLAMRLSGLTLFVLLLFCFCPFWQQGQR